MRDLRNEIAYYNEMGYNISFGEDGTVTLSHIGSTGDITVTSTSLEGAHALIRNKLQGGENRDANLYKERSL